VIADIESARRTFHRLYADQKSDEAVAAAENVVALIQQRYGETHTELAEALHWLAHAYHAQGDFHLKSKSEELLKRNVAIRETVQGPDHPDVGFALKALALSYESVGRGPETETLLKRNIALREVKLGTELGQLRKRHLFKAAHTSHLRLQT
jgi:hypothetical protein